MKPKMRVSDLKIDDLILVPVWEFTETEVNGDYILEPVLEFPVRHMQSRIVGAKVTLANGDAGFCVVSSIGDLGEDNVLESAKFSLFVGSERVPVYPYSHPLAGTFGPDNLAAKLRLRPDEVFPFHFDLRALLPAGNTKLEGVWDAAATFSADDLWERALAIAGQPHQKS